MQYVCGFFMSRLVYGAIAVPTLARRLNPGTQPDADRMELDDTEDAVVGLRTSPRVVALS
jgi:hypothetical protein